MISRDKGKTPAEDTVVHKKKQIGRKPYTIECRFVGPVPEHCDFMANHRNWRLWGRYKTRRARDAALTALNKKADNCYMKTTGKEFRWFQYQFRAGE